MQQPDTTFRLSAAVSSAPWIKQQEPSVFLIPGNMAMPKNNTLGMGKLLAGHTHAIMRIAQNKHDTYSTVPHDNFAFDWQLPNHLVFFDITLHSHNWRYGLPFRNDGQNSMMWFIRQNIPKKTSL